MHLGRRGAVDRHSVELLLVLSFHPPGKGIRMDDFVITASTVKDGQLIAAEIEDAQRPPRGARARWYLCDPQIQVFGLLGRRAERPQCP
jgi:hypothetical protein